MTEEQEGEFMDRICMKSRAAIGGGAEQVIAELREYVNEQRRIVEEWRRNEKGDEEMWRRATRDGQKTKSTSCDAANEVAGDDRGSEVQAHRKWTRELNGRPKRNGKKKKDRRRMVLGSEAVAKTKEGRGSERSGAAAAGRTGAMAAAAAAGRGRAGGVEAAAEGAGALAAAAGRGRAGGAEGAEWEEARHRPRKEQMAQQQRWQSEESAWMRRGEDITEVEEAPDEENRRGEAEQCVEEWKKKEEEAAKEMGESRRGRKMKKIGGGGETSEKGRRRKNGERFNGRRWWG